MQIDPYLKLGTSILLLGLIERDPLQVRSKGTNRHSLYDQYSISREARSWVNSDAFSHLACLCGLDPRLLRRLTTIQAERLFKEVRN